MDTFPGKELSSTFPLRRFEALSIWGIAIAVILILGGSLVWVIHGDYEETLVQEYRLLESHARFGDAQIAGALRSMDWLLQSVIDDHVSSPALPPEMARRAQAHLLKRFPEIHFLITTDNNGRVVTAQSLDDPASVAEVRHFDASRREDFIVHRDAKPADDDRYLLSRPSRTIAKRNTIALSRAIRGKDGRFMGIALVSMSPNYFEAVLDQILPVATSGTATLLNRFGDVIYRLPGAEVSVGRSLDNSAAFQAFLRADQRFARYLGVGDFDGSDRVFVYRNIGDSALAIGVSSQFDPVMARWRQNLWRRGLYFVLIAAALLTLAWYIQRSLREQERTNKQLEESEAYNKALFANSRIALVVMDPVSGCFLDCNEAARLIYGMPSREAVIGLSSLDVALPQRDDGTVLRTARPEIHDEALTKGSLVLEWRHRRPDGEEWDAEVHLMSFSHRGKSLIQICLQDITERKTQQATLERQVRERTTQLRALTMELSATEERERKTIAHELHDGLCQTLAVAKLKLSTLTLQHEDGARIDELKQQVKEIESLIDASDKTVRSLSLQLSPAALHEFGLMPALEWLADEIQRTYGLHVNVSNNGVDIHLDEALRIPIFRAARELLINVAKHARVDEAELAVTVKNNTLILIVTDAGIGFAERDGSAPSPKGGFGLFSVRERIGFIGGDVQIDSSPGDGAMVVLTVPLRTQNEGAGQ
ncbi:MAG: histidine kinase [Sterolibacterium sp.]